MAIPALIVSGYLGSGKTTLVRRLLEDAQRHGVRLAIISNEFGDTGIDKALLDAGQDGLAELDGGCVCCKLSDALGETIERVVAVAKPDRLVLETSGVALPGEVRIHFWRDPIAGLVSDEAVIVVADATRIDEDDLFAEQVGAADVLLLNKCDKVGKATLEAAEAKLTELSAGRPVHRTVRCDVDPDILWAASGAEPVEGGPHDHEHVAFNTFERRFEGVVDTAVVVAAILAEEPIRAKGFVRTADGLRLIQGVGDSFEVSAPPGDVPAELVGRIVIIRKAT